MTNTEQTLPNCGLIWCYFKIWFAVLLPYRKVVVKICKVVLDWRIYSVLKEPDLTIVCTMYLVEDGDLETEYLLLLLSLSSLLKRRIQMNLVASRFSALIQWTSSGIPHTRVKICPPLLSCLTMAFGHVLSVKLVRSHPSSGLIELSLHFQLLSVTTPWLNTPRNPPNPFGPL